MNASSVELMMEGVPLLLVGVTIYRWVLSAAFHNTKYLL